MIDPAIQASPLTVALAAVTLVGTVLRLARPHLEEYAQRRREAFADQATLHDERRDRLAILEPENERLRTMVAMLLARLDALQRERGRCIDCGCDLEEGS
ncbi:MAG: hypothetical protein AAFP22_07530 [Planctomycetota bacterium]